MNDAKPTNLQENHMKLLFIIKSVVFEGGGAERVLADIVNGLHRQGHHVEIATFDHPGSKPFYHIDNDIKINELGILKLGEKTGILGIMKAALSIRKLTKYLRPNVVIPFMHSAYIPTAFGLIGTHIPCIISEHTTAAHFRGRHLERFLTICSQHLAFAKTVVSKVVYNEHETRMQKNLHCLPNPVNLDAFESAQQTEIENNRILCVGGFRKEKDHITLIDAFDHIAEEFPNWHIRFVGDGTERDVIERRIAYSKFAKQFELAGVKKDVISEYANASIIAMPSLYEAFPMVAIESMAAGRPVLGFSDCAGARTLIIDGKNGLLIDPEDNRARAFSKALRKLMNDKKLRQGLGANAPTTVQKYSLKSILKQWEELLQLAVTSK